MPNATFSRESGVTREMMANAFKQAEIDARVFFWPLSGLNLIEKVGHDFEISNSVAQRSINLPSYHDMTFDEIEKVSSILISFIK
jgi:perosamine synthetase